VKYLHDVPFSTPAATDAYRSGWEVTFGKARDNYGAATPKAGEPCPCESGKRFEECHAKEAPDGG
jgi:uncharacterized protein YecA (UPF0149 family)